MQNLQNYSNGISLKQPLPEIFDFLLSKIFINNSIKVVSNKGWLIKDQSMETQVGGEQPIDVSYTIIALEKFYATLRKSNYKKKAMATFSWI